MNKKEYSEQRKALLNSAQQLIDDGKFEDFETKAKEIEKLDSDFENYAKAKANARAMEGGTRTTNIYNMGEEIEGEGEIIDTFTNGEYIKGGDKMPALFLNKGDKLFDRTKTKDEETQNILSQEGALGDAIRGMVTGKWSSIALKNAVTTTATGALIPEVLSSRVIDLARDSSLFTVAGVPVVPMETNNMTISRVKTDPVFSFKKEGEAATESSFELDSIKLSAKTCYGYAYVTLESIKSSRNLDTILYQVFSQAIAQAIDTGMLYGQETVAGTFDTFAPSGIMNDVNINSVTATSGGGYDDIIKAIGKIRAVNGKPTVLGINANTEQLFSLLKTTDGQYLNAPNAVNDLQKIVSNQLKTDATAGDDAIVFDPNAMMIGMQNNIQIKIIEDSDCLKKGLIGFQIYSMLDCKTIQPKNICKIAGIK